MSRHIWSKPDMKWKGFGPGICFLSLEKLKALPLVEVQKDGQELPTTVAGLYARLADRTIQDVDGPMLGLSITTDDGELEVKGSDFGLRVLAAMLNLQKQRVSVWNTSWFWYDSDDCRYEPDTCYSFFVVSDNKIVEERVCFFERSGAEFDPSIFEDYGSIDPTWSDERHWEAASDAFWYRKFYTETRTGQLMVLRPDKPKLHYFPEGRLGTGTMLGAMDKIYGRLGWVLIALVVLLLVLLFRIRL